MMIAAVLERQDVEIPLVTRRKPAKRVRITPLGPCNQFRFFIRGHPHPVCIDSIMFQRVGNPKRFDFIGDWKLEVGNWRG
jgi:hypothetical protein